MLERNIVCWWGGRCVSVFMLVVLFGVGSVCVCVGGLCVDLF